jgi:hypothetical protein
MLGIFCEICPQLKRIAFSAVLLEGFDGIYWKFSNGSDGQVKVINGIVWSLGFSSPLNESLHLTLDQAIEKYGEPEYVLSQYNPNIPDWGGVTLFIQR